MKKIVFFDIDGTLIDVPRGLAEPSELTKYAIKELMNNGNLVFVATGRYKGVVPEYIKELNPSGYILSNGAYAEYQGDVLYENGFDHKIIDKLADFCLKENCILTAESQDFLYTPRIDDKFKDYLRKWKIEYIHVVDKKDGSTFYKCVTHFDNYDMTKRFEEQFKGSVDYRAQTADPECLSYDINIVGINKGNAVDEVIKKLGIDKENTYCFCDGSNDLELVKACGNSYVVKNGDDDLKKIATGIADDVLNDGVYKKLVELGLIKEKK